MKKLLSGDAGTRKVTLGANKKFATVQHCWKKDRDSQRYALTFEYSIDVSQDEMYRYAMLWINKDFQNRMRGDGCNESALKGYEAKPISIKEMYSKKERNVDPMSAAKRAVAKMSDADKAELAKLLVPAKK